MLDPAFAALLRDLNAEAAARAHGRPVLRRVRPDAEDQPLGGRDHWPTGFSLALAGGGIRGGLAIGETDPEGVKDPVRPTTIEDVHATVLTALGLNPAKENIAPATGRPIKLSAGKPIRAVNMSNSVGLMPRGPPYSIHDEP